MLRHPVSFAARGLCRHFPNTMPAPTRRFVADSCNSKAQKESRLADQTLCSNGDGWTRHLIPSCAWELQAPDTLNLPPANNLELWLPNDKRVFDPTPATLATVQSLVQERELWAGKDGIDWGTGTGILALALAKFGNARSVTGLDIDPANIACAQYNADRLLAARSPAQQLHFFVADSFAPESREGWAHMATLKTSKVDFLVANPPADFNTPLHDDGFGFRRQILRAAPQYVKTGGLVLLQWLSYYTVDRAKCVCEEPGTNIRYMREVFSTPWVPLWSPVSHTTSRQKCHAEAFTSPPLLLRQLEQYAEAEANGALPYECSPSRTNGDGSLLTAAETLQRYEIDREPPLCRWTTHLFQVT